MWVKVDDAFPEHEKVLEAGRNLGRNGCGRVLAIWLAGICYCNRNLTDGRVPEAIVRTWILYDRRPTDVADVMVMARLLSKVEGGYRFHDYLHYQPSAEAVKDKRARDRARKAEAAKNKSGQESRESREGIHADSAWNPERSRARDPDPARPGRSPLGEQDHRGSRRAPMLAMTGTPAVLKALIWAEVKAGLADGERDWSSLLERIKVAAARARIDYTSAPMADLLATQYATAFVRLSEAVERSA